MATAPRRAAANLRVHLQGSVNGNSRACAVRALSALEDCSPEMEASRLASSEASDDAQKSVPAIRRPSLHLLRPQTHSLRAASFVD